MRNNIKKIIKSITPPIIWEGGKALLNKKDVPQIEKNKTPQVEKKQRVNKNTAKQAKNKIKGEEKGADWYDSSFDNHAHWKKHYSLSKYYFLWTVIADRISKSQYDSLLEVGCGTGQLANLLKDKGISKYHGFDFSPKRIEQAKKNCEGFDFSLQDAFKTELFNELDYNAVICTEFLEHVEGDLEVLKRIKSGTKFYGTVPNFPYTSHVRHFKNEAEVFERYQNCFKEMEVDTFLANNHGKKFFLIEGVLN
ncbi:class I SAM-dependent methyltransferase [Aliikangiella sp. G2MR2-5]|uniref:class I SAM-dependent methyltransferase n=1 Tax=Aliikangiella sp. G2MR2-5 TaxID=2788943 RepID=UPI0018A95FFB